MDNNWNSKKSAKIRGFMYQGASGHRLELKKRAKIKGLMH